VEQLNSVEEGNVADIPLLFLFIILERKIMQSFIAS
jgi:hypothetical protein